MKLMISGHRIEKLANYDLDWIKESIDLSVQSLMLDGASYGMSGMASGVDIWFCQSCLKNNLPYAACIPFDEQEDYMEPSWKAVRQFCIESASAIFKIKNSYMVDRCDYSIIVWDGNKGGTHNCLQQLLEKNKNIVWIIPNKRKIITF